jgi:hypothetical protein
MHDLMRDVIDFSRKTQQFSSYLPQSVFKIFDGNGIHWICGLDNLIYSIKNLIAGLLVERSLMMEI